MSGKVDISQARNSSHVHYAMNVRVLTTAYDIKSIHWDTLGIDNGGSRKADQLLSIQIPMRSPKNCPGNVLYDRDVRT